MQRAARYLLQSHARIKELNLIRLEPISFLAWAIIVTIPFVAGVVTGFVVS